MLVRSMVLMLLAFGVSSASTYEQLINLGIKTEKVEYANGDEISADITIWSSVFNNTSGIVKVHHIKDDSVCASSREFSVQTDVTGRYSSTVSFVKAGDGNERIVCSLYVRIGDMNAIGYEGKEILRDIDDKDFVSTYLSIAKIKSDTKPIQVQTLQKRAVTVMGKTASGSSTTATGIQVRIAPLQLDSLPGARQIHFNADLKEEWNAHHYRGDAK